jgi:hypothetical protein
VHKRSALGFTNPKAEVALQAPSERESGVPIYTYIFPSISPSSSTSPRLGSHAKEPDQTRQNSSELGHPRIRLAFQAQLRPSGRDNIAPAFVAVLLNISALLQGQMETVHTTLQDAVRERLAHSNDI